MLSGAALMQQEAGLSIDAVRIVQALVLLFVAADVIVRAIFRLKRDGGGEAPARMAADQVATGWGDHVRAASGSGACRPSACCSGSSACS